MHCLISRYRMFLRTYLRATLAAAALGLGAAFLPATYAADVKIVHKQGQTVLSSVPKTVVVYDLAVLDTLRALGVEPAGVPGSRLPAYLADFEAARYKKVGTLFEPDYEALQALKPDLIIVGGRSSAAYDKLKNIAPTLDLGTGTDHFVNDVIDNVLTLGRIFDKQEQANAVAARVRTTTDALRAAAKPHGTSLLLFTVNGNIMPVEPRSRFGIVYEFVGMPAVVKPLTEAEQAAAAGPRPEPGTPEALARSKALGQRLTQAASANPDWIFVLDRGAATGGKGSAAQDLAAHAAISNTPAWKAGRVFYLDPPTWYLVGGGVTALIDSAALIQAALDK